MVHSNLILLPNISAVSLLKLRVIRALFIAVLLNNRGISASTTSLIILTFILAITQGRVTFFNDFTFNPSPNLKHFVPSS